MVWLSEDATGITQKVVYDVSSNQLVGIVLPLDVNGMPVLYSYKAQSIADIERFMRKPKSSHAYVKMAQPIKAKTPPFLLQIYGNDNKFRASDVLNRWKFVKFELEKYVFKFEAI